MAKKVKFHFNPETLNYEPIIQTFWNKLKNVLIHAFSGISLGGLFFLIFVTTVQSPREKQLNQEKNRMQAQYKLLDRQLNEVQKVLTDLQQRDDNMYRAVLQAEPIPLEVRTAATANTEFYQQLLNMTNSELVVTTTKKLAEIRKQLYIQSRSYDELITYAKNRESMLQSLPAIQPVLNKDLTRVASGFGWRMDPVYRTTRFHLGVDFTAPTGTDVYATAQGTVKEAGWKQGYGNTVHVYHGFGYETLYAHLSVIKVRSGQKVRRGDVIGLVGNTGKSTGPHLHYEVHYKGEPVNPMNFFFLDLSPAEYDKMVQMSNNSGMLLD